MKVTPSIGMWLLGVIVALAGLPAAASTETSTLVVCAPGFPGSTAEAQPAMDDLAGALADQAGRDAETVSAVYFEDEAAGIEGLGQEDAALALVTLPFFLEHRQELALQPVAQAVSVDRTANEVWTLVAGTGRIESPGDLAGWEIVSLGGYSTSFVLGFVFDGWGEAPEGVSVVFSNRVLTALRRSAKGENVAVLLDGEQAGALDRLPFADDLVIVRATELVPASLLCSVGKGSSPKTSAGIVEAAMDLSDSDHAVDALAAVRIDRFVALDAAALERATVVFDRVAE